MSRSMPPGSEDVASVITSLRELPEAVSICRRCTRWQGATQGVAGEGEAHSALMLVGEVPGDAEDLQGRPFVGPAGALLDKALESAGVDRRAAYVTNAVKHFKFEPRGKRRLHVKPNTAEIQACHWWLEQEMRLVAPKVVIALGATAARALLGRAVTIGKVRGSAIRLGDRINLWVTVHPSSLLRMPDEATRRAEYARFVRDLHEAWRSIS